MHKTVLCAAARHNIIEQWPCLWHGLNSVVIGKVACRGAGTGPAGPAATGPMFLPKMLYNNNYHYI